MNKKLIAFLAVAAMGVAVAGATPQTTYHQGETQVNLGYSNIQGEAGSYNTQHKGNFNGGIQYGLSDKAALEYNYSGLNAKVGDATFSNRMHEVNVIRPINKNFAAYAGYANIGGDAFASNNNIAQLGLIAKTPIGGADSHVEAYDKGAVGTKNTSFWEAGLGYKATQDLDINAGYKQLNTENGEDSSVTFKGFTAGASYRFQ